MLEQAAAIDKKKRNGIDTGPLCGVPMVVKDNIDVAGYITAAGTPALRGKLTPLIILTECQTGLFLSFIIPVGIVKRQYRPEALLCMAFIINPSHSCQNNHK